MKYREVLLDPTLDKCEEILRSSLVRKHVVIMIGKMSVYYEGRAASKLEMGDRILMIKRDGAVLIHDAEGYKPINWQPNTSTFRIRSDGRKLIIDFIREKPREVLTVIIQRVVLFISIRIQSENKLEMYFTEEELKKFIVSNPGIIEDGLRITRVEYPIDEGKIDILGRDSMNNLVIIELKKGRIGDSEILQLYRYVKHFRKTNPKVRGIIVGTSISPSSQKLLKNLNLEFKRIDMKKLYSKAER